jgi:CheY-like chemotaxis protein
MRDIGGTLDLEVDEVEVDETLTAVCPPLRPGLHACLTVRDTGCGMTPEVLARIYEPFFTTRPQGEGTGMGLAVVHGIVADHGGAIAVESAPGRGSTFRVLLPVVPAPPASAAGRPAEPPVSGRAERVLFVDDDPVQVDVAREMLAELGYRFIGATSGREALSLVRADPDGFDVVLTDALMPGMSGDSLAAELVLLRADLPILLCSGYGERTSESHPPSVRGFLAKPYSLDVLGEALRKVLETPRSGPKEG